MKTRFLFNSTSNSCETFYDGGCGSNNNNFETRENCEDNCKGRVQRPIPPGETEVPPEKSIVSSCANNPCHNGASCIVTQQSSRGYICQCTSGYSGVNCDQAVQAVPCVLSNPCQHGGSCNSWRDRVTNEWRYACACTDMYEGDHCEQESACGKIPCLNGGTCQLDREGKPYCLCTRDFAGKNCTEENPCNTENICKNGGTCNSWRDQVTSNWAHNCKCTDLYSGTSCDVANACATYSCRNGGTCRSSLQGNPFCSCTQEYRGTFCETKICPQNYTECFSNKRFSLSDNFTECRAQVFEEYTKTSQCLRRHYDNIRNGRLCDCNDEDASIISTYLSTRKEFLAARRCFVRNPKARLEPGCPVHTRECLDLGLIAHRGKRRHSCARLNRTLAHSCIDRLQEGSLSMDDCEGYRSFHEEFDNIILAIKRYILKCDGCNLSDLMELCLKDQDGRHPAICRRMVLSRDTVNCVMDRVTGSDSDCSKVELLVRATMEQQLAVNTAFYNRICKPVDDYLKERAGWSCDNPDGSPS